MKKILSIGSIAIVFILVLSSFPTINASKKLDFKINQIEDTEKLNLNKFKEFLENTDDIDWKDYLAILFAMTLGIVSGVLILGPIFIGYFIASLIVFITEKFMPLTS